MAIINNLPNSPRWAVMQTLFQALHSAPDLVGARVVRNPRGPASLKDGSYTVFLKDQTDTLIAKGSGQVEKRQHQFLLGVVARTDAADCEADALHEAAVDVLRNELNSTLKFRAHSLSQAATQFESASLEVDGALVISTWDLEYIKPGRPTL